MIVNGSYYNNSDASYALEDGGRTIILGEWNASGLGVHREIYVPSDGSTFARYLDVLTNPGTTPITCSIRYEGYTTSSIVTSSSDGDLVFEHTDTYLATDNSVDGDNRASLGHVFMDGQRLTMSNATRNSSSLFWYFDVTIGPGETVRR